ncbi:MAG: hypothetical protein ACOYCE_06420 [Limnochordia bacterium]|jgi:hypothetical protein
MPNPLVIKQSSSTSLLGWLVTFLGVEPTPEGNSIWRYRVEPDPDSPPTSGLSHLDIGLCLGQHVVLEASPQPVLVQVGDPSISPLMDGVYLIKFNDLNLEPDEPPLILSFTLAGNWEVGDVPLALKAGQPGARGEIQGPSCTPFVPKGLTQLLCVSFDVAFTVEASCQVTDVSCQGPCN